MKTRILLWVSFDEGQTHLSSLYCYLVIFGVHGAHGVRSLAVDGWGEKQVKLNKQSNDLLVSGKIL